jgi:hypothetical protein
MSSSEELEYNLRLKIFEFVDSPHIHDQTTEAFYIWQDNPDTIKEFSDEDDIDDEVYAKFLDWFIFDFRTFDNNLRIIELFYKDPDQDLNKEEKLVIRDWIESTRSYFIIKDIKSGEYCILKELFSDNEVLVHDTIISSKINLTDFISARLLKTLDKYYFFSLVSIFPLIFKPVILDFINNNLRLYREDHGDDRKYNDYLKDYGYLIGKHIDEVVNHPYYLTPEGEEFVVATSEYELKKRSTIIETINNNSNFSLLNSTADDLIIFRLDTLVGKPIDVHIEIEYSKLTVNCNSVNTLNSVKIHLEELLENYITHTKDSSKKFNSISENRSSKTFKLPKGVRSKKQFNNALDEYYSEWIDKPQEQLGGITPRKALLSPDGRNKLEIILKELEILYEDARKAGEPYYDVSKLREELQNTMI